jgi:hypothetical protein
MLQKLVRLPRTSSRLMPSPSPMACNGGTSAGAASDIYRDGLPLINSGRIELLDSPQLVLQLCALERRVARSGKDSIDHPPGSFHDDVANAVMGVLVTATSGPQTLRITDAALRRLAVPSVPAAFLQPVVHKSAALLKAK